MTATDDQHMRHALVLAARALGRTGTAPSVGCVIVSPDGHVVGRGQTGDGGRPHAEAAALAQAGSTARGATVYVTLEPCSHIGKKGPPCADALVKAGVARVAVAMIDPDPRTNGAGIAKLQAAGIVTASDVLLPEAEMLNRGFILRTTQNRPLVTLKVAQSADGFTARAPGEPQWITGEDARRFGHLLRAKHDAILVGIETAIADDPELTCRLPGLEKYSPIRIVFDSKLRLDPNSKLARTARSIPTLVFTVRDGGAELCALDVEIIRVDADRDGHVSIPAALRVLAERGIMRLLVEGGATVHSAFLSAGFADRLEIFTAPMSLGNSGRGGIDALTQRKLAEAPNFVRLSSRKLGQDRLESYAAKA
ncbi:MAG: bifunctional diaminohydroxyphosphoribosylaminopyrimidine deaminase/5-amino-6-(5-phosphoribosylamino)uracil reductase RibD [Rhizomicrobium sp.]